MSLRKTPNKNNKIIISTLATASAIVVTVAAALKLKDKVTSFDPNKRIETTENVFELITAFENTEKLLISKADVQCNIPSILSRLTAPTFLSKEMPTLVVDYFSDDKYSNKVKGKLAKLSADIKKAFKNNEIERGLKKDDIISFVDNYSKTLELLKTTYIACKNSDKLSQILKDSTEETAEINRDSWDAVINTIDVNISSLGLIISDMDNILKNLDIANKNEPKAL